MGIVGFAAVGIILFFVIVGIIQSLKKGGQPGFEISASQSPEIKRLQGLKMEPEVMRLIQDGNITAAKNMIGKQIQSETGVSGKVTIGFSNDLHHADSGFHAMETEHVATSIKLPNGNTYDLPAEVLHFLRSNQEKKALNKIMTDTGMSENQAQDLVRLLRAMKKGVS